MKRYMKSGLWISAAAMLLIATACESEDNRVYKEYTEVEQEALDMYMADNVPNAYRQSEGYYIEPIDLTAKEGHATNEAEFWARLNYTSRSLDGDVCYTRNDAMAIQQGTFDYKTYYAPIFRYISKDFDSYYNYFYAEEFADLYYDYYKDLYETDGVEYALLAKDLTIDGEVVNLYAGNKFRVYMTSALRGSASNGVYGYAGSTNLDRLRPMVSEVEIVSVIPDADDYESDLIEQFQIQNAANGAWTLSSAEDANGVYINYDYTPEISYNYINPYNYGEMPYYSEYGIKGFDALESAINASLIEEYGVGEEGGETIGTEKEVKVWYVLRTLDGFIIDTNIKAVGKYAFGQASSGGSIAYCADENSDDYIAAWLYSIPYLKDGAWATILTKSEDAYGEFGQGLSSDNRTEIAPHAPLLFNVYVEKLEEEWE